MILREFWKYDLLKNLFYYRDAPNKILYIFLFRSMEKYRDTLEL